MSDRGQVWHKIPETLAIGLDERDLHVPRRDDAATAIADAAHPCAERKLRSKRDAGAKIEFNDGEKENHLSPWSR